MQNNLKIEPSEELLNNWKIWMAIEVIQQFKNGSLPKQSSQIIDSFISFDKEQEYQTTFESLEKGLKEKTRLLKQKYSSTPNLKDAKRELENFYFDIVSLRLQHVSQKIGTKEVAKLKQTIFKFAQNLSPVNMLKWLQDLSNAFLRKKNQHEKSRINYIERETAAFRAYNNLSETNNVKNSSEVWNALFLGYVSLLKAEKDEILSQMFYSFIQLCQIYIVYTENSISLLNNIEDSLRASCNMEITSIPVFSCYLNKIDVDRQQKLLEVWIGGHCINHWGNAPVSWQQIKQQLFINLTPIAELIFKEFNDSYIKQIIILEDRKDHLLTSSPCYKHEDS